ncbi:S41 family peptidase, partial [candidate division KSB1 bacterium]
KNRRYVLFGSLIIVTLSMVFFSFKVIRALDSRADIFMKTKIFTEILMHVSNEFVDPIDANELLDKAIYSLIQELDPHSNYVPAEEYVDMTDRMLGFQGIGIQFRMMDEKITVMRVLSNGPSERAGLKLGDRITHIDGKNVIGAIQEDVPPMLKNNPGTRVTVTVERPGVNDPFDVVITRGQAFVESIKYYYMIDEVTGYIFIETFSSTTSAELAVILRKLEGMGMQRLVLDLRSNVGGLLTEAIRVSDNFLTGNNLIVKTKGRNPVANEEHNATSQRTDVDYPVLVLINEQSASASEIVAGALQDWDRAIVVGKTSFGKGLVQTQIQFEDKSALILTIGRWYTPLGRLIQKEYSDLSRQEYRMQAFNDSLNRARETDASRPTFTTPKGRTVYGGGGITPDFEVESNHVINPNIIGLTPFVNRLILDNREDDPFFRYAQEYALENKDKWANVEEFLNDYKFEGSEITNYFTYLKTENFNFNENGMDEPSTEIVEWYLQWHIAEFLWGDEGKIKAAVTDYTALQESLKYLQQAEDLVKSN